MSLPLGSGRRRIAGAAVLAGALLAPAAWGLSPRATARLRTGVSPYLKVVTDGTIEGTSTLHSTFQRLREARVGRRLEDGTFAAGEGDEAGTLAAWYMPMQLPGLYRVVSRVDVDGAQTAYVSHQRTLPARQPWTERIRYPVGAGADGTFRFDYYLDRLQLGYLDFDFAGAGSLRVGETTQDFHARILPLRLERAARFDFASTPPPYAARQVFDRGRYLARFGLRGGALSTLVELRPTPVKMAVVVSDGDEVPFERLQPWYDGPRWTQDLAAHPDPVQPQRELLAAPWWASIPVAGDDVYELSFTVRQPGTVWLLFQYDGAADLDLQEITVYRQHLDLE